MYMYICIQVAVLMHWKRSKRTRHLLAERVRCARVSRPPLPCDKCLLPCNKSFLPSDEFA